jgi:citrate lyase subunit beta/citryl-CoA lyase
MTSFLRSFLFVPAADDRLFDSACNKNSDVVILDLEDGTHTSRKPMARQGLPARYAQLSKAGKSVAVRVNGGLLSLAEDLMAAVRPGLDLLVLPKVEHARDVQMIAAAVEQLEKEHGMATGHVKFLLQIESAAALPRMHDIAASDARVMGMMLGSEDFSLDLGGYPTEELLLTPSLMLLYAARAAGIQPIGFIASIANLGDTEEFKQVLNRSRALGFRGAVVVHPKFVDAINECFTPTAKQVAQAKEIVDAFEAADREGIAAIKLGELMVDKPVYKRALQILAEARS